MKIVLNPEIMKKVDVVSAVILAVAESAGAFPASVRDVAQVFPYADKKTIRNKLNALAELGFLQRYDVPCPRTDSMIHVFEKKDSQ